MASTRNFARFGSAACMSARPQRPVLHVAGAVIEKWWRAWAGAGPSPTESTSQPSSVSHAIWRATRGSPATTEWTRTSAVGFVISRSAVHSVVCGAPFKRAKLTAMRRTWVVIPMYNESTMIESVVRDVRTAFPHVVCVDDGSGDGSAEAARAGGAVVVEHPINMGQGAALQTGFAYALSDPLMTEVVTFDADGQHQVADAVEMVEKLRRDEVKVVIGSRFLDDRTQMARLRRAILKTAAAYTRMTTGMALTDAHNGLRVIDRSLLASIHLSQNRMAHASELIDQIGRAEVAWAEHPTHVIYSEYSKAKGQSLLNSVNILFELIFR